MDPVTIGVIAATAVKLISAAITKAGESVVGKTGEEISGVVAKTVGEKVSTVLKAVLGKTREKPAAAEAIDDVLKEPKDEDARAALRKQLVKIMSADPQFAEDIRQLLEQARSEAEQIGTSITVTGSGAAATSGGVAAGEGGAAVQGDVEGGIHIGGTNKAG